MEQFGDNETLRAAPGSEPWPRDVQPMTQNVPSRNQASRLGGLCSPILRATVGARDEALALAEDFVAGLIDRAP